MGMSMRETHTAARTAYVLHDNTLSPLECLARVWRYGATCWVTKLRGVGPLRERPVPTRPRRPS